MHIRGRSRRRTVIYLPGKPPIAQQEIIGITGCRRLKIPAAAGGEKLSRAAAVQSSAIFLSNRE